MYTYVYMQALDLVNKYHIPKGAGNGVFNVAHSYVYTNVDLQKSTDVYSGEDPGGGCSGCSSTHLSFQKFIILLINCKTYS